MPRSEVLYYEFGPFRLDVVRRRLLKEGAPLYPTPRAFDTLVALVENRNRMLSKEELLEKVWGGEAVEEGNLTQTIFVLRKMLGDSPREHRYITTIPRKGYRFVAAVREGVDQTDSDAGTKRPATNLPAQTTPLIGRGRELVEVGDLLRRPEVRLITFSGPGGVGKTRLALELAGASLNDFPDGAYLVSLADVRGPDQLAGALIQTLSLREDPSLTLAETLEHGIAGSRMLIVLDSMEHVIEGTPLVTGLLARCPLLKILVTSRVVLRLRGEHEYPVPPLAVPRTDRLLPLEELAACASVALFVERCQTGNPQFRLTADNAAVVGRICARLEGLPLAIELAAARSKLLPPAAMLPRLEKRLDLLARGATDLPARQQALRKTIEWSFDLLTPLEKMLFRRLGVFQGGCSIPAAEAVVKSAELVLGIEDAIQSLADKSLLRVEQDQQSEARLWMLDTIREFALECVRQTGEETRLRNLHAVYFLRFAEEVSPKLSRAGPRAWVDRVETERDNILAALDWFLETRKANEALLLAGALGKFWEIRGYLNEGRNRLASVLRLADDQTPPAARGKAYYAAGILADAAADYEAARGYFEETLAIHRMEGNWQAIATSLNNLGVIALRRGDASGARSLHEESLGILRQSGSKQVIAWSLNNLGQLCRAMGDYQQARICYEESLAMSREAGDDHGTSLVLSHLGALARELRQFDEARELFQRSLSMYSRLGNPWAVAACLAELGDTAAAEGEPRLAQQWYVQSLERARESGDTRAVIRVLEALALLSAASGMARRALQLSGVAQFLREALGAPLPPDEKGRLDAGLAPAFRALDPDAATAAIAAGRALDPENLESHPIVTRPVDEAI